MKRLHKQHDRFNALPLRDGHHVSSDNHSYLSGTLYVIAAALLWAASGSASKFLFNGGVSPFHLVQMRTTIAATALALLLAGRPGLLKVAWKDLPYFMLLGVILAAVQSSYLFAISKIHVAAAILLQYQAPIFIAAYAVLFARKRLTFWTVMAIAGSVSGCYLMVGAYSLDILSMSRIGILSGLFSAVAFAWYSVKSEYGMRTYSPWTVVCYALVVAAVVWNLLQPPLGAFAKPYSAVEWSFIVFIGFFGTVLPFAFYNEGIRRITSTHAGIIATLEPVAAGVIAYVSLGEVMELWQIIGAGVVIASIAALQVHHRPETPLTSTSAGYSERYGP
ncbi:MAG: DMT family transporter [Nitrospirota bacterium]